jgi:hypothetical protein
VGGGQSALAAEKSEDRVEPSLTWLVGGWAAAGGGGGGGGRIACARRWCGAGGDR